MPIAVWKHGINNMQGSLDLYIVVQHNISVLQALPSIPFHT